MHKHGLLDQVLHANYESEVYFRFWTFYLWGKIELPWKKWLKMASFSFFDFFAQNLTSIKNQLKGKKARLLDSSVPAVLPNSIEGLLANFLAISTLHEASVSTQ